MSLDSKTKDFIIDFDKRMKTYIANKSSDEVILASMLEEMPKIKNIMDNSSTEEMNKLCEEYDGFYYYMKLLENLATGISTGNIVVPN
jgi:hypothetical protein